MSNAGRKSKSQAHGQVMEWKTASTQAQNCVWLYFRGLYIKPIWMSTPMMAVDTIHGPKSLKGLRKVEDERAV